MRGPRALPAAMVALAIAVWALPLQFGVYANAVITDIPVYRRVYEEIAAGNVPYADFSLEYPPLAAALFWVAGALPGPYEWVFSILMLAALCAVVLGVVAIARALGYGPRRQAGAGALVAISPLLIGNLVETRFDMALAALVTWVVWAAVTERWRTMWILLAAATLLKLVPLALVPALMIWQIHRVGARPAWRGAGGALAIVVVGIAPFAILSPSGTWDLARYHLDRPLQLESLGSGYLLALHALADIPITVESSFGSQGLAGTGPAIIAGISTAILIALLLGIWITLRVLLQRARPPADARILVAAIAATIAALLVGGKVLSPQFMVWLLPVGFLVAGRYGRWAAALTVAVLGMTFAYFPHHYWELVALDTGPIAVLVVRDALLIGLLAACWPRPDVSGRPRGLVLGRVRDPERAEKAVAARYLID